MSTFQQALESFSSGEAELGELRRAMLEELASGPERYETFRREVVRACTSRRLPSNALEELLDAFDEGKTRIATVHSVVMPADADATVFDSGATEFATQSALSAQGTAQTQFAPTTTGGAPADAAATTNADPVVATVSETHLPTNLQPRTAEVQGSKLQPGDVLNDQFELEEAIGEGGMGVIFRAKDTLDMQFSNSNPYVAVKVLSESFSGHRDSVMALHRETRNARSLRHDNIIRVDAFARDSRTGQYFMVMEYLRGEPLNRYMQRKGGKRLSFDEVWRICRGTGEGLQHAHAKGIIHSDIKPSNIWITEERNVKVLDFGIARVAKPDTQTVWEGLAALSVPYATQEMLRREDPDERDDVYALACVTYELLAGQHPFHKIDALQAESEGLVVERPKGLKALQWKTLRQALSLHRDDRTPNIAAFLEGMQPSKPPIPLISAGLALVATIFLLVLASLQGWFQINTGTSEDDQYVAKLLEVEVQQQMSKADLDDFLEEGHYLVDLSREEFENRDIQQGNRGFKNGVSTAFGAFYSVLEGTDDPMMREAAARGILNIHKSYADTIARLHDESMPKKALWLTCQSLAPPPGSRVPDWPQLAVHYQELWREVKGEEPGPHTKGCNTTQVLDSWGDPLSVRSASGGAWYSPPAGQQP